MHVKKQKKSISNLFWKNTSKKVESSKSNINTKKYQLKVFYL